jgi:peptidoglycan L-alanyl-D-glutamate endopeptidase CwlK
MSLSQKSRERLNTCDPRLIEIMREVSTIMDITVICGFRGEKDQNDAFAKGNSKLKFPKSKHNRLPSLAVDVAPLPLDWNNIGAFINMVKVIKEVAAKQNVKIRCGADFEKFKDYPHIELVN